MSKSTGVSRFKMPDGSVRRMRTNDAPTFFSELIGHEGDAPLSEGAKVVRDCAACDKSLAGLFTLHSMLEED